MTAAAATRSSQPILKRLAGVLGFVCLVLLLLALDQRQTVDAFTAARDAAAPVAGRVWTWMGQLPSGAANGWTGFRRAVAGDGSDRPLAAIPGDLVLAGEYTPVDAATRETAGRLAVVGARLQFERGGVLRTAPLRIAAGRDAWAAGQTFAGRLAAAPDAQIELRTVVPAAPGQAVEPSRLCDDEAPAVVALLHRGRQVDVMLFRRGVMIGAEAPPSLLCGAWRYRG